MDRIKLGKSELKVSRIGLGCAQLGTEGIGITDPEECRKLVNHALDCGINFLDTAEGYGDGLSEKVIGEVLKERGNREDVVIATKVNPLHLGFDEVLKACYASLRRLQTDRIDLYQVHAPFPTVPISETMIALRTLLDDGSIRYAGISNFQVSLTEVAVNSLDGHEVISNQIEYSLLSRGIEKSILTHARWRNMSIIAYSPLAKGLLSGKYGPDHKFQPEDKRSKLPLTSNNQNRAVIKPLLDIMEEVGRKHDAGIPEIALNWLLKHDDVIPIPGAKSIEQLDSNVHSTTFRLSQEDWERISQASKELRLDRFFNYGNA